MFEISLTTMFLSVIAIMFCMALNVAFIPAGPILATILLVSWVLSVATMP